MKDKKIFLVEFGEIGSSGRFSYSSNNIIREAFVIASNFDDAHDKALNYAYEELVRTQGSVLDEMGSIVIQKDQTIKVSNIKIVSEHIIY